MPRSAKKTPVYKQMAFETAVRNPERYFGILKVLKDYDGHLLSDDTILQIVSRLYLEEAVSSSEVYVGKNATFEQVKDTVISVNSTRRSDGGFPAGYSSRFWTYVRTLSEFGMVYARYKEPLKLADISNRLLNNEIDEQEAFSIQALKYNRKSPYRNVANDYNFFRLAIELLFRLKESGKKLSYEQFIVLTFNESGSISETIEILEGNSFGSEEQAYVFVKGRYQNVRAEKTVMYDYPDVVRRIMILCGFITIRYDGKKFIELNEKKIDYMRELFKNPFELDQQSKTDARLYFERLNVVNDRYVSFVKKYREADVLNAIEYTEKLKNIISTYDIDEEKIVRCMKDVENRKFSIIPEFKEIPPPLKLEFFTAILIALKYENKFKVRPNYKADHVGKPYSHAPGNRGDVDVFSDDVYWLIEVTLIRNKSQLLNNETSSLMRHLSNEEFDKYTSKYLSLVAPVIHDDTKDYFDFAAVSQQKIGKRINIKAYDTKTFTNVTCNCSNLRDMEENTERVFSGFKANILNH